MEGIQKIPEAIKELAALLRCPVTGQRLSMATPEELSALSKHVGDGFLIREDKAAAYPVVNGIPSLLPESLIPLSL